MAMTDIKGLTEINGKPANLGDKIDISWLANSLDDETNSVLGDNVFSIVCLTKEAGRQKCSVA